jgi:hypothetical protein
MNTHKLAVLPASFVALAVATGAQAQPVNESKQTPESAQRFMATVLPGTQLVDHRLGELEIPATLRGSRAATDWMTTRARTSMIKGFKQGANLCQSQLEIYSAALTIGEPGPSRYYVRNDQTSELPIDWSKTLSARSEGTSAFIATLEPAKPLSPIQASEGTRDIEVRFADEGFAARFAYAAEFLRLSCDPVADTGF